jgi:NADH-quinone oxidoreductase subunit G
MQQALAKADEVIAFSAYAPESLKALASVILPIGLLPEIDASLTNAEGVEQRVSAAAKLPGDARPGWRVLRVLGDRLGLSGFAFDDVAELRASLTPQAVGSGSGLSPRVLASEKLQRIATTPIYRGDAVVRRAAPLQAHGLTREASVSLHPDDAGALGLNDADIVRVDDGAGVATLPLTVSSRVPRGGAWVERGFEATGALTPAGSELRIERV